MKKSNKLKKENNKKNTPQYFVHFNKPDILPAGFEFIEFTAFVKKNKSNSCDDIMIGDLLEYFNPSETLEILTDICNKLKSQKKIYIQGVDAKFISSHFANDQMSLEVFNAFVFGLNKKYLYTIPRIKQMLKNIDLNILSIKFINSFNYYIECEKK